MRIIIVDKRSIISADVIRDDTVCLLIVYSPTMIIRISFFCCLHKKYSTERRVRKEKMSIKSMTAW
jgi:hypothetical protein